jgi:hypothetical protein
VAARRNERVAGWAVGESGVRSRLLRPGTPLRRGDGTARFTEEDMVRRTLAWITPRALSQWRPHDTALPSVIHHIASDQFITYHHSQII